MVDQDIVENYQSELLKGSDNDAAQRGLLMPSYAPLQSRLSGYKTYQEKTKYTETDLPGFDLGEFHMKVLNDRGPEPLTIDDIQRDSTYVRNTVMNLREHGQRSNVEPFLNEVQLYESQQDPRGSENIPTDRLRAEVFLSKKDYHKATLYVDDIGNMRTEEVSDFERRDLIWNQQEQARKRTILFEEEKTNYNTLAGAINPRTTENSVSQAVQKYNAITDQNQQDQKYQVKIKTYNDIHDENINFQAVPDHSIPVADYSQVFIKNAGSMPLNYLYAFSKQRELDKKQFEEQQEEYNCMQKQQIIQYVRGQGVPKQSNSIINSQQQDQDASKSLFGRILNKISTRLQNRGSDKHKGDRENNPIYQNFELLITLKRQKRDLCNAYYNRLQCVEDQLKVLNLDSNLIYKMPHQVDRGSLADLQVIEDFLVIAREAPKQSKSLIPKDNKYMQSQTFFDQCLSILADKYLSNSKNIPRHLLKQINNQYEQTQQLGRESFQGNKVQLQSRLNKILSQFNPQNQQLIKDQKKQLLFQSQKSNQDDTRIRRLKNQHIFGANQDPQVLRNLINPVYSSHKKQTDLNPNSFEYNDNNMKMTPISDNQIQIGLQDASINTSRAPLYIDQKTRFSQFKELNNYERLTGE